MPAIGFLHLGSPEPNANRLAGFRRGLSELGFVEGRNLAIEFRWAGGQVERLPALAADLVRRQVKVIVTPASSQAALATKAATRAIPIVFAVAGDPIEMGLVASLNRPVLRTVDTETKDETVSFKERTDVTAVPAAGVVAETMVSLVLANEVLRKFGGDSLPELLRNHRGYLDQLSGG